MARGVSEIDWCLKSGNETFVTVGLRVRYTGKRGRVFQNSADEKERSVGQSRVTVAGEKRFIAFPKRDASMHAAAVIGEEWLGHKSDGFVVPLGHVAHDVFVVLHVVCHLFNRGETNVDFSLARGRDFVVLALDRDARLLQLETHFI